jgi:L-seryl-tRNA(Ser) seleniumtransferase
MDAVKKASQNFVIMMELMEKAGEIIAEATGAEAGLVSSGASAGLVLGSVACMMRGTELENYDAKPVERIDLDGNWREIVQRLPDTSWTLNEFIIQKNHRNPYDHAFVAAGGRLKVVGDSDGCSQEELEEAINNNTAAIAFTARSEDRGLSLDEVHKISSRHNIPIIVDAAAELPPRSNLKHYINQGADLVVFSGGKHIGGPNDTGILCGRNDLIKLAFLQGSPYRGICRGMKVDRSQIVGLITALRLWLDKDEEEEFNGWLEKSLWISGALNEDQGITNIEVIKKAEKKRVHVEFSLNKKIGLSADDFVLTLRRGNPSIWVYYPSKNHIIIDPSLLKKGEEKIVVSEIKKTLKKIK